jgi:hypothetical protein
MRLFARLAGVLLPIASIIAAQTAESASVGKVAWRRRCQHSAGRHTVLQNPKLCMTLHFSCIHCWSFLTCPCCVEGTCSTGSIHNSRFSRGQGGQERTRPPSVDGIASYTVLLSTDVSRSCSGNGSTYST